MNRRELEEELKRTSAGRQFLEEAEPCEDAISRAEAIRIASGYCHPSNVAKELATLSPVKPTHKKGKWIVEVWNNKEHHTCSNCQHLIDYEPCYHYCPICGAEMEEEE